MNPIQEAIIWSLHELGARICVVGDDDQTIYQWRGSDVENILTFDRRYPNVEQIPLEGNFRSSEGVVQTAGVFIEQNSARLVKAMKPTSEQPYKSSDIVALSFSDSDAEARYIVETIQSLRGIAFKDDNVERGLSWRTYPSLKTAVSKGIWQLDSRCIKGISFAAIHRSGRYLEFQWSQDDSKKA